MSSDQAAFSFLRSKIREDDQAYISYDQERNENYFYKDKDLKNIAFSQFTSFLPTSGSIIDLYTRIRNSQDKRSLSPFLYKMCLLIAYSGLKDQTNKNRIFEKYYIDKGDGIKPEGKEERKEKPEESSSEPIVINSWISYSKEDVDHEISILTSTTATAAGKTELEKFWEEVKENKLSYNEEEKDVVALKIAAYCFAMLTSSVKSKDSVKAIFMKIDDYIDSKIYSLPSNFRMEDHLMPDEFVEGFGNAVSASPIARGIILNSYRYAREKGGKEQNLLYALALTRLVRHGLPVYTLALPIANLYAKKNNKVSISSILRTGLTTSTEESIKNFVKFTYSVEMSFEEYTSEKAKTPAIGDLFPRSKNDTTYFWPIARLLDDRLLLCLGRAKNPDLIVFLIELNKACETPNFQPDKITKPSCKYDKFEELASAARTYLVRQNLNPEDMLPEIRRILENQGNKPQKIKAKVVLDDDSDIDG